MLDKETKQRINSARQILVGKVPDPKAQVEQITNALIYKFMDDMDRENEELGGKAQFLTGDLKEFSWGRLMSRELSGLERWDLYTRALSSFAKSEQIPELFRTIFKDAYLPYRDPETLNLFLKEINGFSYGNSENLGNAFEYLLSILGSQGDAGQFRTPRHIIDFIVEVVNPQKTDRILDPACGTAGFLIASYKHIQRNNAPDYNADNYEPVFMVKEPEAMYGETPNVTNLTTDDRKRLAENIVGYDISPDMVRLSLVNLYLHGFSTPRVYEYDTLTYEERWGDNFDIILANPPFMTPRGGIRPHKRFSVQANRSEVLFVDYIFVFLSKNYLL
jgi:type I restriction enzyme M protein